jgi:hypothetical protein
VDVGAPVVADTETSKLIEPGKCPLDDPSPSSQTAAVLGASHRQQRQDAARFATRIGLPLHRSRGLPPHNLGDAAAVPARPGVEESHRPAPAPPASRFGWRRSGEPRAARPARRRSDDACSRAWPDQWDLDRSGHRRGPRGWNNCPRPPATNQFGRSARASPAAQSASDPKRPPVANRAGAASPSSPARTRVPAGASARECRCEGRRRCPSGTRDPKRVVGHLVAVGKNRQEGFDKIPQPIWKQRRGHTPFTLLRRRGQGSGGFVTRSKHQSAASPRPCDPAPLTRFTKRAMRLMCLLSDG